MVQGLETFFFVSDELAWAALPLPLPFCAESTSIAFGSDADAFDDPLLKMCDCVIVVENKEDQN